MARMHALMTARAAGCCSSNCWAPQGPPDEEGEGEDEREEDAPALLGGIREEMLFLLLPPPPEEGEEGSRAWERSASARGPAAWRSSSSAASAVTAPDPLTLPSLPLTMAVRAASRDSCSSLARCRGMGAAAVGRTMDLILRAAHSSTRAASRIASSRVVDPRSASPGIIYAYIRADRTETIMGSRSQTLRGALYLPLPRSDSYLRPS